MTPKTHKTYIYDFAWDDDASLGVWVGPDIDTAVLVEASITVRQENECGVPLDEYGEPTDDEWCEHGEPTGEYVLASVALAALERSDLVCSREGDLVSWPRTRTLLRQYADEERTRPQVAVNDAQERLLAAR